MEKGHCRLYFQFRVQMDCCSGFPLSFQACVLMDCWSGFQLSFQAGVLMGLQRAQEAQELQSNQEAAQTGPWVAVASDVADEKATGDARIRRAALAAGALARKDSRVSFGAPFVSAPRTALWCRQMVRPAPLQPQKQLEVADRARRNEDNAYQQDRRSGVLGPSFSPSFRFRHRNNRETVEDSAREEKSLTIEMIKDKMIKNELSHVFRN